MENDFQTRLHDPQNNQSSVNDDSKTVIGGRKAPLGHDISSMPPKKKGFNKKLLLLLLIPVVLILLAVICVAGYFVATKYLDFGGTETTTTVADQRDFSPTEAIDELAMLNLSLSKIQEIEKNVIHTGAAADEERLNRRLIALKHLYTNEFLRDTHSVQNLRNVYLLYSEDFSETQQNAFKWFFSLPDSKQIQYEYVQGGISDFDDFRRKVESEMSNERQ